MGVHLEVLESYLIGALYVAAAVFALCALVLLARTISIPRKKLVFQQFSSVLYAERFSYLPRKYFKYKNRVGLYDSVNEALKMCCNSDTVTIQYCDRNKANYGLVKASANVLVLVDRYGETAQTMHVCRDWMDTLDLVVDEVQWITIN